MFSSVGKFLDDSKKAIEKNAIVSSLKSGAEDCVRQIECTDCKRKNYNISAMTKVVTYCNCPVCDDLFCKHCISRCPPGITADILMDLRSTPLDAARTKELKKTEADKHPLTVCTKRCLPRVNKVEMKLFTLEMAKRFSPNVRALLENDTEWKDFYDKSTLSEVEDTTFRKMLRFQQYAEIAASFTGLSTYFNAIKFAYYSHTMMNMLIAGNAYASLQPLMDSLAVRRLYK